MQKKTHAVNPLYCGLAVHRYTEYSKKIAKYLWTALIINLHSTTYGNVQEPLLTAVHSHSSDLILMAGDIADHKVPHKGTLLLLEGLKGQYLYYYVMGNYEHWIHQMSDTKKMFTGYGVTVLGGRTIRTVVKGQSLTIGGMDDSHAFTDSHHSVRLDSRWKEQLWCYCSRTSPDIYSILLSYWPKLTKYYGDSGFDLVVAGHAHGGQFRMLGCPGRLPAPHQDFFPRYAGGQYALGFTSLTVSRGLCINRPSRIYNPPELVLVGLKLISQNARLLQSYSFGTASMNLSPPCWKKPVTPVYGSHWIIFSMNTLEEPALVSLTRSGAFRELPQNAKYSSSSSPDTNKVPG